MLFLFCLLQTLLFGHSISFLLNSTADIGLNGYQNIVGLIMDEKLSRHRLETQVSSLEDKLNRMEQFNAAVTKELQKERNNRQQLINQNAQLNRKLMNETAQRIKLETRQEKILSEYNMLKLDFNKLTIANQKLTIANQNLTELSNNLTMRQDALEKMATNLTNGYDHLTDKYRILLEQYLAITSHNQDEFVQKHTFTQQIQTFDRRIHDMNNTLQNITERTTRNSQKIKQQGAQLGFSVKSPAAQGWEIKFKETLFNSHNIMLNTSLATFTCTLPGLYFFTLTIVREPGIKEAYCSIAVNEVHKLATVGQASNTTGYATGTAALVYHLDVGDKVRINDCGGLNHMYKDSSFSGFLISPDP